MKTGGGCRFGDREWVKHIAASRKWRSRDRLWSL